MSPACDEVRKPPSYDEVLQLPRHDSRPLSRHQYMVLITNMQKKKPQIEKPWGIQGNWNDACQDRLEENLMRATEKNGRQLAIKCGDKDSVAPAAIEDQPCPVDPPAPEPSIEDQPGPVNHHTS